MTYIYRIKLKRLHFTFISMSSVYNIINKLLFIKELDNTNRFQLQLDNGD